MKSKSILFALLLTVSAHAVFAQNANRFNPEKEKKVINGYTIRLVPLPGNTFGFNIMKGNKPVYLQLSNPLSGVFVGYKNKDDAFKLAEWVINEDAKNMKRPVRVTPDVANKLNLPKQ